MDEMGELLESILSEDIESVREIIAADKRFLPLACKLGNLEIVKLLLEAGADINKRGRGGETALHAALCPDREKNVGRFNLVALLLNAGADPKVAYVGADSALHYAVRVGNRDIVALLLRHGANMRHPGEKGETPLGLAAKLKRLDLVDFMENFRPKMEVASAACAEAPARKKFHP